MQKSVSLGATSPAPGVPESAPAPAQHAPQWPHPTRAWITVWVLMAASTISYVDRQILTLLVEPIQRDLAISDTQFSLLAGLAFVLFYSLAIIPLAWVADRWSRKNLIAASLVTWSAMTGACGLATSLPALFAARIGVGVGEAGLTPAAYSMISDSFPPVRRAPAIAVFSTGTILGIGLALMLGGAVAQWAAGISPVPVPIIGELRGWQMAFMIVAAPGALLSLIMLYLREPARKDAGVSQDRNGASAIKFLRQHSALFFLVTFGYALVAMAFANYLAWTPAVMTRAYGWNIGTVGAVFGAMVLVFTGGGIVIGGWWVKSMQAAGRNDAIIRVSLAGAALALPFTALGPFSPDGRIATIALAGMCAGWGLVHPMAAAAIQTIAPNRLRARLAAIFQLSLNVIAFVLGPTAVAVVSDNLFQDPAKIGWALGIVSGVIIPFGMVALYFSRQLFAQRVAEEIQATREATASSS